MPSPQPSGGDQNSEKRSGAERGVPPPVQRGVAGCCPAVSPQHRIGVRCVPGRRYGIYRHGADRRHHPQAVYGKAGPAELAGVSALHHPDHAGPQPRPQPWHHPPGHQAPEHHGPAGRQREGGRFRHRLSGGFRPDPDAGGSWLRPLYFPGAGPGRPARRPQRYLFLRRGALRDAHRAAAL